LNPDTNGNANCWISARRSRCATGRCGDQITSEAATAKWTKASRSPGRKIDPVAEKQSLGGGGRYVVGDLPVTNGTNRQRACGCSNVVLFGLMHFSFCILYASTRRRLHTQADAGGHTGIICNAVGYRVFSDNQDGCRIASFRNVAGSTPVASSRCSRCIIFGS
jgi:hypothetical protein